MGRGSAPAAKSAPNVDYQALDKAMKAYFEAEYTFGHAAYEEGIGFFSLSKGRAASPEAERNQLREVVLKLMPPNEAWFSSPQSALDIIQKRARDLGKEDVRKNPPLSVEDGLKKRESDYLQVSKDAIASFADARVPEALKKSRVAAAAEAALTQTTPAPANNQTVAPVSPNAATATGATAAVIPTVVNNASLITGAAAGAPEVQPAPFFTTQPFPSSVNDGQSAHAGKKDPAIQKLQLDLEKLGRSEKHHDYKTGNNNEKRFHHNPNITAESMDGIRGPLTEKAITTFREKNNLQDKPEADVFAAIHEAAEKVPNAPAKAPNKPKPRPPSGLPDDVKRKSVQAVQSAIDAGVSGGDKAGNPSSSALPNGKGQTTQAVVMGG